ncbi:MAG: carboxymuconolactone decarboxylase family protein [Bacteroidota bacterium]|nr:carboxymuconolactone decarboxylase family protein [Bacteroidota bacterium]MDP4250838.1 carboxymuconolactone decarboxylase family protein [Bacteroidota bacterium]
MSARLKVGKVQPEAYKALNALDVYNSKSGIDKLQREMIKIRASQINGCAYCVNSHTKDALKLGETPQRIFLMSVWREAKNVFSEEEQLLLEMTEQITLIHQHGLSDELYEKSIRLFGEEKTAQIIMAIITINAWNRIGVGLNMEPEL